MEVPWGGGRGEQLILRLPQLLRSCSIPSFGLPEDRTERNQLSALSICRETDTVPDLQLLFWGLHWIFVAVYGLSLTAASRGSSLLWCGGFSLQCVCASALSHFSRV